MSMIAKPEFLWATILFLYDTISTYGLYYKSADV